MSARDRWPLRWQIAAAVSLTALLTALAVAVTAYLVEHHLTRERFVDSSATAVAADANQLSTIGKAGGQRAAVAAAQNVSRLGLVRAFAIYQGQRSLTPTQCGPGTCFGLPGDISTAITQRSRGQSWVAAGGGPELVATEPISGTDLSVVVTFDYSLQQGQLTDLRNELLAITVAAAVLGVFIGWATSVGVSRPVRRAAKVARSMGGGDLAVRMPEQGSRETAELGVEFNRMASRLGSTVDELRETNERQRRFVADVSHELRTPVAAISAAADALDSHDQSSRPEAVSLLQTQALRLSDLIGDLLDLSRTDAGQTVLDRELVDLAAVARDAAAMVAPGDDITINSQGDPYLSVDVRRLHTALRNLLTNAVNHGAPPISVNIDGRGNPVIVAVSDHGPGVPGALRTSLFDRFVRGDHARSGNGRSTGLGLALVRQNVELHGGTITLDASPPTAFVITLPRVGPAFD